MESLFVIDDSRNFHYIFEPIFWKEMYTREYKFIGQKNYPATDLPVAEFRKALDEHTVYEGTIFTENAQEHLVLSGKDDEYMALLRWRGTAKLEIMIGATSRMVAEGIIELIDTLWKPSVITREDVVPFWFWSMGGGGANATKRKLEVFSWKEIEENYIAQTKTNLDLLMQKTPPFEGGRLILWHGEPGTGKTHSIRALAKQWSRWCKAQYIMDPDRFFDSADYMMSVMTGHNDEGWDPDEEIEALPEGGTLADKNKWNLVIVEDADEFLRADAKARQGQALSRLLNTTDGLIGQGLKVIVLITTNAHIGELHPAVHRAGRCLSNIEFASFSPAQAKQWLESRSDEPIDMKVQSKYALSDLYESLQEKKDRQIVTERATVSTGAYL